MNRKLLLPVLAITLASLACSLFSPKADPNSPGGDVLFQDDFSGKTGSWSVMNESEGATEYTQDAYHILVNQSNYFLWANPEKVSGLKDVHIEVDATKAGGPGVNDMGVICRYQDEKNFYFFTVSSDGYYGLWKMKDGEENLLDSEEMQQNETAIRSDSSANHLRLDCTGSTLTGYANGTQLASVQDTEWTSGNVGLLAGTYDDPGVDIRFDNFKVLKP